MSMLAEISQRDLRLRSKDIMDAVERGESFTITRDGRPMGQLIPLRHRFVSRERFVSLSEHVPAADLERFRADQAVWLDPEADDPYAR